jgi:hypothetical protein
MCSLSSQVYCKIQPPGTPFIEVGKTYEWCNDERIVSCANFLHCFQFWGNKKGSKYFRVQLGGEVEKESIVFYSDKVQVIEEWSHEKVMESITEEMCFEVVFEEGLMLEHVPKSMVTPELCLVAVSNYARAIMFVPEDVLTHSMCFLAVMNKHCSLEKIPRHMLTPEICFAAVTKSGNELKFVPNDMVSPQMRLVAALNDKRTPQMGLDATAAGRALRYLQTKACDIY